MGHIGGHLSTGGCGRGSHRSRHLSREVPTTRRASPLSPCSSALESPRQFRAPSRVRQRLPVLPPRWLHEQHERSRTREPLANTRLPLPSLLSFRRRFGRHHLSIYSYKNWLKARPNLTRTCSCIQKARVDAVRMAGSWPYDSAKPLETLRTDEACNRRSSRISLARRQRDTLWIRC